MTGKTCTLAAMTSLFLAACATEVPPRPVETQADPTTAGETLPPTTTETETPTEAPTPTETPDPLIEASQNLPEGSGTIQKEGENWIFNSPLEAEVGKNIPVIFTEHIYEDETKENWIVLVEHPEWPLFIQNESREWETALEYVEVKRPLLDTGRNPILLTCKDDGLKGYYGSERYTASCFFVVRGKPFQEGDRVYIPAAIPLDGQYGSPMLKVDVPVRVGGENKDEYPGRIFDPILGSNISTQGDIVSALKSGDVFWLQFSYDNVDIDAKIQEYRDRGLEMGVKTLQEKKETRERVRAILSSINKREYTSPLLRNRLYIWVPGDFGIGY